MTLALNILILAAGFYFLVKGADGFIDAACKLAEKLRVPELVIGLTIVAFGTSAPELAVSLTSAIRGASEICLGNVVGSNVLNIVLILGITAMICKIPAQKNSLVLDLPIMLLATVLLILFGYFGLNSEGASEISRVEGSIMFALLLAYIAVLVVISIKSRTNLFAEDEEDDGGIKKGFSAWYEKMCGHVWFLLVALVITGVFIVGGSHFVVNSAVVIAEIIGVPEKIIALTMIALGTSLPELVTSITAARKGKTDIAIGNIIGSNIFNILCVAGFTAILKPIVFEGFMADSLIALGAAVLLSLLCYLHGHKLNKVGGVLMLLGLVGYLVKIGFSMSQ